MKFPAALLCALLPLSLAAQPTPSPAPVKLTAAEIIAEREKYAKEVRAMITGHEKEPAETVFKNIKVLKGVPAGRVPAIMNLG